MGKQEKQILRMMLVGLNARYTHSTLALFYLRNELEQRNCSWDVRIDQFTINDPYYELLLQLSEAAADYYFFSASIWNSDLVGRLADDLLAVVPHCRCLIGGPQAEIMGEEIDHPRVSVVLGAIEKIGEDFYHDLGKKTLKQAYRCGHGGNDFSFPYRSSDFHDYLQNRNIYYESSRGCIFACTYCLSSAKRGVHHKDIARVRDELDVILKWRPPVVRFVDRTFNDDMDRALAIWEFLLERTTTTVFHFEMSPDRFSEKMFSLLEEVPVGRFQFEIGVQSTNEPTLKAIRRPMDVEAAAANIRRLKRLGTIHLHVDLILGLPWETRKSYLQSFGDVFAMEPHYIQMGLLKILPNTPLCGSAGDHGYRFSSVAPYPVLANRWLDHRALAELYWFNECVERFVNNRYFVCLWAYLRESREDMIAFFLVLYDCCRQGDFFQRAPTQEYLATILLEMTAGRDDAAFIHEAVRYDWLRCGHRFLPPLLADASGDNSVSLRKLLFRQVHGGSLEDHCGGKREYFLKKGFFQEFSAEFLQRQGFPAREKAKNILSFVPERDGGLYRFVLTALFVVHETAQTG